MKLCVSILHIWLLQEYIDAHWTDAMMHSGKMPAGLSPEFDMNRMIPTGLNPDFDTTKLTRESLAMCRLCD
jgi:hypothetical protein